jgi:hypothetical protein
MPVQERLMALGGWSVRLKPDAPHDLRRQVMTPFQSIVITPSWVDPTGLSDAALMSHARYTGVILNPGPSLELSGVGNIWWLGDDQGRPTIESSIGNVSQSLASWFTALRPASLAAGSVAGGGPIGGSIYNSFLFVSRRQAWETICRYYQVEYRINPDWTIDYGTQTDLYGSVAKATAMPKGEGGRELLGSGFRILEASQTWDYSEHLTKLVTRGRAGRSTSGSAFPSSYDPQGGAITRSAFYDIPDAANGMESNIGNVILNRSAGRVRIALTSDTPDVRGVVGPGDTINVWDPDSGLIDPVSQVFHQGQIIFPWSARIVGMTWGISEGMGVYVRQRLTASPDPPAWVDLSPYVDFEPEATDFELGDPWFNPMWQDGTGEGGGLSGGGLSSNTVAVRENKWDEYTPTVSGTGTAVNNGTVVGAYRREGTTLHIQIVWTLGTTSTVGAGGVTVSLPSGITGVTRTNGYQTMPFMINDTGTATYEGKAYVASGGTTLTCAVLQIPYDPTLGAPAVTYAKWVGLTATVPHTWASTDFININGTIEVAP